MLVCWDGVFSGLEIVRLECLAVESLCFWGSRILTEPSPQTNRFTVSGNTIRAERTQSFGHLNLCFSAKEKGLALALDQVLTSLAKSSGRGRDS